ncbi:MAG: hypothetical protein QM655_03210 [Nocardioidaceae bacterium]
MAVAAVPAIGSLLSACGGGSDSSKVSQLNAIFWAGFFDPALPPSKKKYGVDVKITPQVDPLKSVNMIKAEPGQCDLSTFGVADTPFIYEGAAKPLDLERVQDSCEMAELTYCASGNKNVAAKLSDKTREIMRMDQMEQTLADEKLNFQKLQAEDFTAVDKWWSQLKLKHQS